MTPIRRAFFALGALLAAASAAAQTVTVYGRLYPEVVWARMTGSTQPGTEVSTLAQPPTGETFDDIVRVDSSNSRLGFRGEEPLGAGLKAFFQIEQRIQVDTGGTQLASRDTFVGLASDRFGTVKMGGFDTVYKEGAYRLRDGAGGAQALDLQPAQGGFVEFTFDVAGQYPFVTHKFATASKGAVGLFQAGEVPNANEAPAH